MFGKKNNTPFRITVLTQDYMVNGLNDPQDENDIFTDGARFGFGNSRSDIQVYGGIKIQSVRVTPTRWAGEIHTFDKWMIGGADTVIAIIPSDEAALAACKASFKKSSEVGKGAVFAGAYIIRGTIMSDNDSVGKGAISCDTGFFTVADAVVTSQSLGKMEEIRADLIVVNGHLMDGYNLD